MIRFLRVTVAGVLFTVPFVAASAAGAQTCSPLDPSCVAHQVVDQGQDVVGKTAGAVGPDDAADTANDAGDAVQGTVDDTVATVRDTVDDTLNRGGGDPPGGGGEESGPTGGGRAGNGHDAGDNTDVGTSGPRSVSVGAAAAPPSGATQGGSDPAALTATDPPSGDIDRDRPTPTIGQVAVGVIGGVALMAILLGAIAAFLAVQDRLDRRDPKLAPPAIAGDRVRFS